MSALAAGGGALRAASGERGGTAAAHGPRAVWGALWYASGSACAVRIRDALLLERES